MKIRGRGDRRQGKRRTPSSLAAVAPEELGCPWSSEGRSRRSRLRRGAGSTVAPSEDADHLSRRLPHAAKAAPAIFFGPKPAPKVGMGYSTVEAAAAAETPDVDSRHRRNPCPHHQCHSRSHHRFRLRHHRRHPRLNDRSLPTPRTGRGPLGTVTTASTVDFQGPQPPQPSPASPSSPLPPSWPQHPALPSVPTCGRAFRPSHPQ